MFKVLNKDIFNPLIETKKCLSFYMSYETSLDIAALLYNPHVTSSMTSYYKISNVDYNQYLVCNMSANSTYWSFTQQDCQIRLYEKIDDVLLHIRD